jgi:hypothetical protein
MKFMVLVKACETAGPPPPAFMDAMGKLAESARRDGTLLDTGGLAPSAQGARIRLAAGKLTIHDGPFAEAKEVVGGFGVVLADTREAAVEGVVRMMQVHRELWPGWDGEAEVRQIVDR